MGIHSLGNPLGPLLRALKVKDGLIDGFLEQRGQFWETGGRLFAGKVLFALAANVCELGHAHGASGALELMEDLAGFLSPVPGESGLEGNQLFPAVRGEVVHDRKKQRGLAGRHGIELSVIKEGHGNEYTPPRAQGKEQGLTPQGGCRTRRATGSGYICRWCRE